MAPVIIVTVPKVQGVWVVGAVKHFFSPDRCFVLSWAQRHKSITSLSTGHLCIALLPQAPSTHYSDGHVSGDEEKSSDLQQSFAALHLGSWTGSCKKKDRQLLSSLGEGRLHPTDQLLSSLNWQSVLFFLKEAVVCVCSVWKRSLFVQFSSEQTGCLVWGKFSLLLVCGEGSLNKQTNKQHRQTSVWPFLPSFSTNQHQWFRCDCVGLWGKHCTTYH